jgi:hypothetical protein
VRDINRSWWSPMIRGIVAVLFGLVVLILPGLTLRVLIALSGLLVGAAFLWVPVVGPLIIIGPLATAAIGALEGTVAGGLLGAILGHQVEKDHVAKMQAALQGGMFVVVVQGTAKEREKVRRVRGEAGGQDVTSIATHAP